MSSNQKANDKPRFSWYRDDLECRLGLRGGKFTRVNYLLSFIVGTFVTVGFYLLLAIRPESQISQVFTQRGVFQYIEVLFAAWALVIVAVKYQKVRTQRKALTFNDLVPGDADFVLSPATADRVLERLRHECDDPEKFILFNRVEMALSNIRNIGRVSDLDDVLTSLAANDEDIIESSYTVIKGVVWSIPVLGFIGTVQGLGIAIGKFGGVLAQAQNITELRPVLQGVTSGLATAFDTTYVALVAALGIQLLLTMVRKNEEELMTDSSAYCQKNLVGRLRLTPLK